MGEMRILSQAGDETLSWDPADDASVKEAKKRFAELKKDGYEFYEVAESRGKKVDRFSKKAGRLIAAPGGKTAADRATGTRPRAMAGGPTSSVSSGW